MDWIRQVSLVKRVVIGFFLMGLLVALQGALAYNTLQLPAAQLQKAAGVTAWLVAAATGFGLVLALLCAVLIRSSIKASVESTVQCVIRVAGGDLETKIESPGKDEISWLRGELNGMRKKLRKMVLEVRSTADSVNQASQEIASGNTDLSARTESQAGALEQTSTAIQQLLELVRGNAQSTQQARQVVTQSSAVAQRGAQAMQAVIGRMAEINGSARKISEIIGVIDGIAFQTNILALNAAVEAARAGEQGRGFAVVASEVRSLAQRSATAAREIKTLISDSTDKVEAGTRLVDDAGNTMAEIVASVGRVSALINDIASAGEAQTTGIGEVHQAVSQIDNMTQQNAALVEQLAASAQTLHGQSNRLGEALGSFHAVAG